MIAAAVGAKAGEAVDMICHKADISRTSFQRVQRRHFGQPHVAVDAVEPVEQRPVSSCWCHCRIGAGIEADFGAGFRR